MRDRLLSLLGIESGEESLVFMLLTQSVFLGIFFGAFDISAHSLFLSIFDEKMMARGYVISGLAGIILTSLYTWLQTRVQFRNFSVFNLFSVAIFTMILWIALLVSSSKWVVFLVFIMLGPLNILAMLGFWGTAGRLFTLRQGKRLFGLVDSGLIIGIIISCYTIPVLLALNFSSHNILLISASSVLVATIIQILVGSRFSFAPARTEVKAETPKTEKRSVFKVFSEDRYTRIMAVFVALSVMTAFFVQYSFMAVTREQYPAEADMARFLGIFTGSMMIFTLLVKLLAFSYLIRNYGLKTCLAISPVLVAAFTLVAIGVGLLMGYTPEASSGFLIFFLILALSRLFSKSLKDSIESPSFKVIYQTIDERIRYEVQSGMDGTVNEIAALSSGLLLAGLGVLSFVKLIHFSFVLFIIIAFWIVIAFMLYSEYRRSIRKALEAESPHENKNAGAEITRGGSFSAAVSLRKNYFRLVTGDTSSLDNCFGSYISEIIDTAEKNYDINLIPALRKISTGNCDDSYKCRSAEVIRKLEMHHSSDKQELMRNMLAGERVPQTTEILRLLRDNSTDSKKIAIYTIGKFRIKDLLPEVCGCLGIPALETGAEAVLASFGDDAVEELIRYYLSSSGNPVISRTILKILGKSQKAEASGFLFSRLWSGSRLLRETAVRCLLDSGFRPSVEDRDRLNQLISDTVGLMTWNISAKVCLEKSNNTYLLEIFTKDIERWRIFLFNLLSLSSDRSSVEKIRENLDKDTVESGNFALEMIDIVIDASLKPKIIALFDIVPDEDKLKNLWQFFPGDIPHFEKLPENIINRDYNLLGLWTKACTLRNLKAISDSDMAESASALLFSNESIIREEAAGLMSRSGKELYRSVAGRIPSAARKNLDRIVSGENERENLVFEKVLFLSEQFSGIPEDKLITLSEKMIYCNLKPSDDCIVWTLDGSSEKRVFVSHSKGNGVSTESGRHYCLPLVSLEEFSNIFPENSPEILTYLDKNE